ncbi:MAG: type II secretion system protein [bacterium]
MKKIRKHQKNGFTLIELLAVIVVLAIVMMIASTQVIPIITSSREDGFASTANSILSTVATVALSDEIRGNGKTCYTVKELIDGGYISNISSEMYSGVINISKGTAGTSYNYEYTMYLRDASNNYCLAAGTSGDGQGYKYIGSNQITGDYIINNCNTVTYSSC